MQQQAGKWLIFIGLAIPATGVLIYFFGDRLRWLGQLPGDIWVERVGSPVDPQHCRQRTPLAHPLHQRRLKPEKSFI
jgi:hypothetical protein